MPSYDVHQHLWPEALIEGLHARRERPRLRDGVLELASGDWEVDLAAHTLEARLAALDAAEIDVAFISCPPTLELDEELVEAYHEGIVELVAASGGRLRALACGSDRDGFVGACVSAQDLGAVRPQGETGARAKPGRPLGSGPTSGPFAGLPALEPLLAELERRGALLFVHPGPARAPEGRPPWWPAVVDYTAQMQAAYLAWLAGAGDSWPDLRVVFAILAGGAPFQLERLAANGIDTRELLHPNVYLDTASYGERALDLSLATYGVGQIVYGSDTPVINSEPTLRSIRSFGEAVADAVCRDNPARLLQ